nr:MAG TPA: hypothetical protein [Caudoviricetes sp.]
MISLEVFPRSAASRLASSVVLTSCHRNPSR